MMFSSNTCRFVICFLSLSLSATAETIRGAQRELQENVVNLRSAGDYVILAKSGITTVPDSVITGNIGVSPITAAAMTGFTFTADSSGTFSTSAQVTGNAYASTYASPTPTNLGIAVGDMMTAYTDAAGRLNSDAARINLKTGLIGGETLTAGVYTFGTDVNIGTDVTISGSATDVFIIQIAGNLIQAENMRVTLAGSALPQNIFWQVAGYVQVGTGAHMEGILLSATAVTFVTGSSLHGRVLAQTACTLDSATITQPVLTAR
jgi:hypothetical protein